MKKKSVFIITIFAICILCFSLSKTSYATTNKRKSFSLVVSGAGVGNGDKDEMVKILQKNKLYSDNSVWQFTYDTEAGGISAGTTKAAYNKAIDTAYKGCTINDTAYFFHSGHGMEGLNKGWGIMLKTAYGELPFSWYKYDDLLEKLSNVPCKHMVIIIHACESGAVKEAYDKLPQNKKNKISLFWSSGANQLSYKNDALNVSVYGQTLIQLLGYDGNLYADMDNDGNVTVKELGDYINSYIDEVSKYVGAPPQTPGYTSAPNLKTVIYSYNSGSGKNTSKKSSIKLNKRKATLYTPGSKIIQLKATVKGSSKKVMWKSSNKKIATVSSKGEVTAKKAGSVVITAEANGKTATCKVIVKSPSIKLNKTKVTIYTSGNKTVQLEATVKGPSKKVTWKASNKKIAIFNSTGKVTAKKAGTVTITAKANGKTAKCKVFVHKKVNAAVLYKSFLQKKHTFINSTISNDEQLTKLNLDYFCVVDINQDGVDDLLVREMRNIGSSQFIGDSLHIFTAKSGKVQYAGSWLHGTSEVNKKYGGIRVIHSGTGYGGDSIISLKNGKCYQKVYLYAHESSDPTVWKYFLNNENNEITEQEYKQYYAKYFENKNDILTIQYIKNNATNRKAIK